MRQAKHILREFLELAFDRVGLDWKKYVETDPRYFRPAEVDFLQGDPSKAKRILGWQPKVGFEQLAAMMTDADWELAKKERLLTDHGMKV